MKIAYVSPMHFDESSYLGGGERYPLNVARGVLAASNGRHTVDFISYGPVAYERRIQEGLHLRVLPYADAGAIPSDPLSWALPEAVAGADVVHIHQALTRSGEVALLVARSQGKAICLTEHGGTTSTLGISLGMLDLADRVVCQSDFSAARLSTNTRVEVIKGGVDSDYFSWVPVRSPRSHVLYVGRLLPHKGVDRLIVGLPDGIPLIVCGRIHDQRYFDLLQALARTKDVRFVTDASDEDILRYYRSAWATVLPSVYVDCFGGAALAPEAMGLSLLESMSCGTPAVCSDVAAMPEFVRHGETGFVYDSIAQLSHYLMALANDQSLVEELGAAGRSSIEADFGYRVVGQRVLAVYEDLVGPGDGTSDSLPHAAATG